jgi:hypothetical protein
VIDGPRNLEVAMGKEQIAALIRILSQQLERGSDNVVQGTWKIDFDKARNAFVFDKCENEGYCEERPSVVAVDGSILDKGGPLFG